jgi:hypothetical protein
MSLKKAALMTTMFAASTGILGCRDSTKAKFDALGDDFKIEVLGCDGQVVRAYISSGKVSPESGSDGYYFEDKATGNLVEVSGNIIITQCDGCKPSDLPKLTP